MTYDAYRRSTDRQPWPDALQASVTRYTDKHGVPPTIIVFHPQEGAQAVPATLQVTTSRAIDKGCWGLGRE